VFGDVRPGRVELCIWVAAPDHEALACARCDQDLSPADVALYTKVQPGLSYDPWCPACAYELVRWAGMGALAEQRFDSASSAAKMEALIKRGRG